MGLAGGIVRKVFSKSPCSSAGTGSRGHHSEKGSAAAADHRRRWGSLRLYLCGEEMSAAAQEQEEDDDDDGETVSVKSFETCCVNLMPPEEANVVPVAAVAHGPTSDANGAADNDNPAGAGEPAGDHGRRVPGDGEQSHGLVAVVPAGEEEAAATLIQSAFRAFMARRRLLELKMDGAQEQEPSRSPTWASVATSVLVQVGEPLSNLRLSEDSASVQQQQQRSSCQRSRPPPPQPLAAAAFRVREEWDDSTVSSNVSRMRIQSRIEATTRRERALAYAFSQQLRSCGGGGGGKKRSARAEQGEYNVGWSWLERWMATRQAEPADDCVSRNADTGSATAAAGRHRRVLVVRRRNSDLAVEEKESCGSNDVSVVSFDGSSSLGGARSGLSSCHKPPGSSKTSRLKGGRSLPRRKQVAAASDHRFQARSHKVSKKGHQRVEQAPHKDRLDAAAAAGFDFDDACQPPTDY